MEERSEVKQIVDGLNKIMVAIESLNPDPTRTIAEYKKSQRESRNLSYLSVAIALISLLVAIYALFKTQSVGILLRTN